jgi:phosphatidylethanolamine-binding protein (PEBP) family uncharacterized protein
MYIVYEAISNSDPRFDPKIQEIGKFWHYTVAYIAPADESSVVTSWLKGEQVSEVVAKANKFAAANNGELTVVNKLATNYEDIISPTSYGNNDYKKQIYFLTAENKTNSVTFIKIVMKQYATSKAPEDVAAKLVEKIEALDANDLDAAQYFMYCYFPWSIAATEGRARPREFEVPWIL